MARTGRPSAFTQALADLICERLAAGESLRRICIDDNMPDKATVIRWKNSRDDFRDQYARAREDQAELYADDIIDIADDGSNDWMIRELGDGRTEAQIQHEHVTRSRLRIDSRKWMLSKLKPGTYGDKIQHANAAGDGNTEITYRWDGTYGDNIQETGGDEEV
jgi:hypothetical protein